MQEQWKLIPKSNNYYVSNLGNVRHIDQGIMLPVKQYRGRIRRECKLKEDVDTPGYYFVAIEYGTMRKGRQTVHRLVANAFVSNRNPEKYKIINHIDGDKGNNHYTNLEWCDYSRNNQHAFDNGLNWSVQRGTNNILHKLTEDDVREIFRMRGKYSQSQIAARFGINQSNVSRIYSEEKWAWLDEKTATVEPLPVKQLFNMNLPYVTEPKLTKPHYAATFRTVRGRYVWQGICPEVTSYGKLNVFRFDENSKLIQARISPAAMVYIV